MNTGNRRNAPLIEPARLIDAHPAGIVAGLNAVLDFPRLLGDTADDEESAERDAPSVLAAVGGRENASRRGARKCQRP